MQFSQITALPSRRKYCSLATQYVGKRGWQLVNKSPKSLVLLDLYRQLFQAWQFYRLTNAFNDGVVIESNLTLYSQNGSSVSANFETLVGNWSWELNLELKLPNSSLELHENFSDLPWNFLLTNFVFCFVNNQAIPGNLQKYVSTNRSLLQCKTLPAHFSNNMMVYCLLNVI